MSGHQALVPLKGDMMKNATAPADGTGGAASASELRRLDSKARRSVGKPELAVYGVGLVVLIALLAFEVSGRVCLVLAVVMLWALGQFNRPESSKSAFTRALDASAKADDEFREQMAILAAQKRNQEEAPWKLDS
jgi:hypothetical protein